MTTLTRILAGAAVAGLYATLAPAAQVPAPTRGDAPVERAIGSTIESVVLYQGRAAITRVGTTDLTPGFWKLRFDGLPGSIEAETLEAKASAGAILSVDYTRREVPEGSSSPEALALDGEIRTARLGIAAMEATIAGLAADGRFVEAVGIRASTDAAAAGGTAKLDLAAVDAQMSWIATQRRRLQGELASAQAQLTAQQQATDTLVSKRMALGATSGSMQSAEVLLALTEPETVTVRLSYLVSGARWEPVYSMRASPEQGILNVEIDAMVVQGSGEPWEGVRLSLSTARPSRAARPPEVRPWFVDVVDNRRPSPAEKMPSGMATGFAARELDRVSKNDKAGLSSDQAVALGESLSTEAVIAGSGPSVTYTIALPFDAPSDNQTFRRARIAAFAAPTRFVYQAQPAVTEGAFLRGSLANTSAFQMLPGKASVFVNADYVGAMPFDGAAPKESFDVYFGADPAVTVTRELIKREDKASGLFGGGLDSESNYRVLVGNATGREIRLELLDFRPVSRSSKVEVALSGLASPLSDDPEYLARDQPKGILRWDLRVPPTVPSSDGLPITWTVTVSRSKDVEVTPLPDR